MAAAACREVEPRRSESVPATPPDIVLVSIDSLRADRLGLYGDPRSTSPFLDRLGDGGLVFDEALAPTPWTLPSHAAMLTGVHPWNLGIRFADSALPTDAPTLAERLAGHGYRTGAIVDSSRTGFLGAARGFDRGFESYEHRDGRAEGSRRRFDVGLSVDRAIEWWGENDGAPRFLFFHTKSVHVLPAHGPYDDARFLPYSSPPPHAGRFSNAARSSFAWTDGDDRGQLFLWALNQEISGRAGGPPRPPEEAIRYLSTLYDDGVAWVDAELSRLHRSLEERSGPGSVVWVVTADHGEAFFERELGLHQDLHRATLRVPWIVSGPSVPRCRVASPTPLQRVPQLISGIVGAPGSRAGPMERVCREGLPGPRELFAYYEMPSRFDYVAYSARRGTSKLIVDRFRGGTRGRAFDLDRDPGEREPTTDPERVGELMAELRSFRRPPEYEPVRISLPAPVFEDPLGALGYVE